MAEGLKGKAGDVETVLVETVVHGRVLVRRGESRDWVVGFHGYGETADVHLAELERVADSRWNLAAVQALHPFYAKGGEQVVASWMTRLDRETAIADNINYIRRVVDSLGTIDRLVFAGFSQGAAMAWRAASAMRADGVIAHGSDVPPDIGGATSLPRALIGRGRLDEWYTAEKLKNDLKFLEGRTTVQVVEFEGGHVWSDEFREAARTFLASLSA